MATLTDENQKSRVKILVIEDDQDIQELVEFLLTRAGYQVLKALDGRSGLEMAESEKPNLILLDLGIPSIDGWKLAGRIKQNPQLKHIPILAVTGHNLPGDRRQAIQSGCDGFITKPLDITTFLIQVEAFLEK